MQTFYCPFCDEKTNIHVEPEYTTTWGRTDSEHGSHTFTLENVEFMRCDTCEEQFLNYELARAYEQKLNEKIKEKLGIDWLARSL
jgi:hypothetical protein